MRRRPILVRIAVGVAVFLAGYAVFWHLAARTLADGVARWADERRAEGYRISYAPPRIGGFPFALTARLEAPAIVAPGDGWRWSGPAIAGSARPWAPLSIELSFPGRHDLNWRDGDRRRAVTAEAETAEGRLDLPADHRLGRTDFAFEFAGLALGQPGREPVRIGRAAVRGSLPPAGVATAPDGALRYDIAIDRLSLPADPPPPLGREIARVEAAGLLQGGIPRGPLPGALAAWRDLGGTLEVLRFALDWGPLGLAGDGTFALDGELQPIAAMSATLRGHGETIDALVESGLVRPREGSFAKIVLAALSRRGAGDGRPEIAVALTAQDGHLYVGPVRLLPLPKIRWE